MSRYEQRGANIFDTETNNERWDYVRLLNLQDEKIKELEKQLRDVCEKYHSKCKYLHQQDKQHRIEELEKIKKLQHKTLYYDAEKNSIFSINIDDYIDQRIKELRGEKG